MVRSGTQKNCLFCRKEFYAKPSETLRKKYCSKECCIAQKEINRLKNLVERKCLNCLKIFYFQPFLLKGNNKFIYCSKECQLDFQKGKNHYSWKGGLTEYKCQICGTKAFVKPSRIKNGAGKFCSPACRKKGVGLILRAKPSKKIEKKCVICGTSKFVKPSHAKKGVGTYCSKRCMGKGYSQINFRVSYSRTKQGKREDLDNKYFRSSWEANYARYLNFLIQSNEISSWIYENKCFEFPTEQAIKTYTPDFEITNLNGKIEYHEVKGWMDIKSKLKLESMKKFYSNINLVLIDEMVYLEIEKNFSSTIENWEFPRPIKR